MQTASLPVLTAPRATKPSLSFHLETIETELTAPYPGCGVRPIEHGVIAHGIGELAVLALTDALGHLRDAGWHLPAEFIDEAMGQAASHHPERRRSGTGPAAWVRVRVQAA